MDIDDQVSVCELDTLELLTYLPVACKVADTLMLNAAA